MPPKKHIIIGVLCVIALGLGYWVGLPKEGSEQENAGNPEDKEETAAKEPEFLKQGLVAYYPFNGNAKDESGNSHHGEVNKAILAVDRHGNPDSAYETIMDGGNILLPNEPVFNLQKHTICGWFRLRQTSTHPMLISKQKPFEGVAFSLCGWRETKINDRAYALHSDKAKTELIAKNTITSNLREWNFFAGTFDGKIMAVYVNGVLSDSISDQFQIRHFGGRVTIGTRYRAEGDRHQASQVDDVRIYNRALSEAEVKELYEFEKVKE